MKAPFTPFELIMTVINIFLFACCIVGDLIFLLVDPFNVNETAYGLNLCIAVPALLACIFLMFRTDIVNSFGSDEPQNNTIPAVSALRTYFCMLFFDGAGVLVFMFAGPIMLDNAKTIILIFAPSVFALAALIYFIRVSRIGLEDFSDDETDDD